MIDKNLANIRAKLDIEKSAQIDNDIFLERLRTDQSHNFSSKLVSKEAWWLFTKYQSLNSSCSYLLWTKAANNYDPTAAYVVYVRTYVAIYSRSNRQSSLVVHQGYSHPVSRYACNCPIPAASPPTPAASPPTPAASLLYTRSQHCNEKPLILAQRYSSFQLPFDNTLNHHITANQKTISDLRLN